MDAQIVSAAISKNLEDHIENIPNTTKSHLGWKFVSKIVNVPLFISPPRKVFSASFIDHLITKKSPTETPPSESTELKNDKKIEMLYAKEALKLYDNISVNPRETKKAVNLLRFYFSLHFFGTANVTRFSPQHAVDWVELVIKWPAIANWINQKSWHRLPSQIGSPCRPLTS